MPGVCFVCPFVLAAQPDRRTPKEDSDMQRVLMAAGSILLLTTAAHPQPLTQRLSHPAVFILADEDDSGSADDADAIDNAGEDSSSATTDEGVTDNSSGDQGQGADDASV